MTRECWREKFSETRQKKYYVNVEIGKSQWGLPINNLPPNWEEHMSANIYPNTNYFSNKKTRISQWDHPNNYYNYKDENLPIDWEKKLSTRCKNVYYVNKKEKKSQWEIPINVKTLQFVIPDYEEVKIVASVDKGKRAPIKTKIVPPRALKWTSNSCYLDSALFAFLAGPREYIDKMLTEDIEKNIDQMIPNICYINNPIKDVEGRKSVQKELRKISNSIMRTGEKVEFCNELRKTFKNCYNSEKYHKGGIGDSGEFITYLLSILSFEQSTIKINLYATNRNGIDLEQLIEEKDDLYESVRFADTSLVHVILSDSIRQIEDGQSKLSDFLIMNMDSGKLEKENLFYPDDGSGRVYNRIIEVRTIEYTPYLIFSLKRLDIYNDNSIITNRVIPDSIITIGDNQQAFSLSAAVMHTGGCHYVAIAKYNDFWWYYNDSDYLTGLPLVKYNSFEDFIYEVENDSMSDKINPYTHGTQFYYTPV
jgi:ubiquitin C-terminal hydrolase